MSLLVDFTSSQLWCVGLLLGRFFCVHSVGAVADAVAMAWHLSLTLNLSLAHGLTWIEGLPLELSQIG